MKEFASILILISLIILAPSCTQHGANGYVALDRFESQVTQYPQLTHDEQEQFINHYSAILTILNQSVKADSIHTLPTIIPTTPIYKSFIADITTHFTNTDTLSQTLYTILTRYTQQSNTRIPQIQTYISPYNQSIIISDSTILIGLNHYLGATHPAYNNLSNEIRINKTPQRISYDIAEALLRSNYPNNTSQTLLDNILYEGFIIHAIQQLHPQFNLATALGYTSEQLSWSNANSQQIWQKLIADKLLYTTNHFEINKLIKPTPYTANISTDSPGKLGVWVGTQIITSYINAENINDINQLYNKIKTTDSQTILMHSKYYGK
ncbi:MAG: hypothetical protein R3Y22_08760 [Bacteroidales bacterium]